MKVIVAILMCTVIPVFLIAAPGFVGGYFSGFGFDCRGTPPGWQSGIASAIFMLVFAAPVTLPAMAIGAATGVFGIRRGPRALGRLLALTLFSTMMAGAAVGLIAAAVVFPDKRSARLLAEVTSFGASGGGLFGLLAAFGVVLIWRRRDRAAVAEPNYGPPIVKSANPE